MADAVNEPIETVPAEEAPADASADPVSLPCSVLSLMPSKKTFACLLKQKNANIEKAPTDAVKKVDKKSLIAKL